MCTSAKAASSAALSLMAGTSSVLAGLEVSYEHYKGSYGQKVMWTPVVLSGAMTGAGIWGFFSTWAARTVLRWTSVVTLLDSLIGFFFHVRGIARKPGGWRLPVTNIVMGPPIFAPLLFGVSAYLGLIASFLRPEEAPEIIDITPGRCAGFRRFFFGRSTPWTQEIREGRFQKHLAVATILSAFFSGFEALYSHYKNNFKYKAQWSPIIIAPLLMLAAALSMRSPRAARTVLPIMPRSPPSSMAESDFITTPAAFFAARADRRSFFITSSTGRPFSRRCSSPPVACSACLRA